MRRIVLLFAILVAAGPAAAATTAFVNVNVLPMDTDTVLGAQTVIVENGTIASIGAVDKVPVPEGAAIIDGTDRFLMPGLTEMHAHVPGAGSDDLDRVLTLFAANGVTTVRGMLGQHSHLELRDRLRDPAVFGPRLVTSGPSMNGNSVAGVDDARRKVREQHAAGYDFIKIHPGLTAEEFRAIATTARELGMPVAGHVPAAVGVEGVLELGMATIDHLDGYLDAMMPADTDSSGGYGGFFGVMLADQVVPDRIDELAAATAAAGTWNVPTESLFEHFVSAIGVPELMSRPEMEYVPGATAREWAAARERQFAERGFTPGLGAQAIEIRRRLILALHRAGAGLLLGSDAPQVFNVPGFSLHRELGYLVAAGLTPFEALETGTTAVAEFLGSNTGQVRAGRDADLVLLDANPLEDIANTRRIHGVMLRGSWYPDSDLRARLDALRDP